MGEAGNLLTRQIFR